MALLAVVALPSGATRAQERPKVEIVPSVPHAGMIDTAVFSPDGALVLSGSGDTTLKLWDAATGRLIRTFARHALVLDAGLGSMSIAFSHDGTRVLSGNDDGMRLWDIATGRLIRSLDAPPRLDVPYPRTRSVAFSPDDTRLLNGRADGKAVLWDAATGEKLRTFDHGSGIKALVFSPDGARVLSGSGERVKLWEVASGRLIHDLGATVAGHYDPVRLAFSPDGARVVVAVDSRGLREVNWKPVVWDTATGEVIRILEGHRGGIRYIAFVKDGALVAGGYGGLTAWDVETGRVLRSSKQAGVAISPDGARVLSQILEDKTIALAVSDVATGQKIPFAGHDYGLALTSLALSRDGAQVLTGGGRWQREDRFGSRDRVISLWDAATGKPVRTTVLRSSSDIAAVVFGADRAPWAFQGLFGNLKLLDAATGSVAGPFALGISMVRRAPPIALSPHGTRLLGLAGTTVGLWDFPTGKAIRTFQGSTSSAESVAFSPDGARIAAGCFDGTVWVWETATGTRISSAEPLQVSPTFRVDNAVTALAFSPDGTHVLAARTGFHVDLKRMTLLNAATGQLVRIFDYHPGGRVGSVAFSPDGARILSVGDISPGLSDVRFRLWETATGRLVHSFDGHSGGGTSAAFTPDGRHILSTSYDGTIRVWHPESGALLATLLTANNGGWVTVTSEGFFDTSGEAVATELLSIVRGVQVSAMDAPAYQLLHRPDLVRTKLAGDPNGKVKAAAAELEEKFKLD